MRRSWMITLLLVMSIAGVGCASKPRRTMRPPDVQSYDLPPVVKRFEEPPIYPEERLTLPSQKKGGNPGMMGPGSAGGGGMGMGNPGMGGGAPGTNPGSLGGFQ